MTSTAQITFTSTGRGFYAAHLSLSSHLTHTETAASRPGHDFAVATTRAAEEFQSAGLRSAQRSVTATVTVAREHFAEMIAVLKSDPRAQTDYHLQRFLVDADRAIFTYAITADVPRA